MKRSIIIVCITTCFLYSCLPTKELRNERKSCGFKEWEKDYKERAFCLCVLKGYDDPQIENLLFARDQSFYRALGIAIFDNSLKPIIKLEVEKIRLDSINSIGSYPDDLKELYQKRRVMEHCLRFYNSKELDKYANKERKKWKKIKSIISAIQDSIPTY